MAAYTVTSGQRGVHAKTLAATTADTVTFTGRTCRRVEVISDGTAALYVTVDGVTAATVAGAATDVLPAGALSVRVVSVTAAGDTVVSLVSAGTPTYDVTEVIS